MFQRVTGKVSLVWEYFKSRKTCIFYILKKMLITLFHRLCGALRNTDWSQITTAHNVFKPVPGSLTLNTGQMMMLHIARRHCYGY